MKSFSAFRHWYGVVALLAWFAPFVIPMVIVGLSLLAERDFAGPGLSWSMLGLWVFASMWSFVVVPWLHARVVLRGEMIPPGRRLIRRWFGSAIVGLGVAVFPVAGFTITDYLLTYGLAYTPYWGWYEQAMTAVLGFLFVGLVVLAFLRRRFGRKVLREYATLELCFGCGYRLRGLDGGACPECGASPGSASG
ncbi:MAG: hypothetical protein AAF911_15600 [Planctomycetota bacterium]